MSLYEPTFEELLMAYIGPDPNNIRYGASDYYRVEEEECGNGYVLLDNDTDEIIFHEPDGLSYPKLSMHAGCEISIDAYMKPSADDYYALDVEAIVNLAITCLDCNSIIYDVDRDFDEPLVEVDPLDYM